MVSTKKTEGKTSTEGVGVTETQEEVSLVRYADAWTSHVVALDRLRWNLNRDEGNQLDKLQDELRTLIGKAVKDLSHRRQVKEDMRNAGVDEEGN